jgi:hypothetical protein
VHAGGEDAALGLVLVHMRKNFAEPLSNVELARIAEACAGAAANVMEASDDDQERGIRGSLGAGAVISG